MNRETSDRVSSIAARIMQTHPPITAGDPGPGIPFIEKRLYDELLADAKTLAGSVMSQDETAGTRPEETFITRLQRERARSGRAPCQAHRLRRQGISRRHSPPQAHARKAEPAHVRIARGA